MIFCVNQIVCCVAPVYMFEIELILMVHIFFQILALQKAVQQAILAANEISKYRMGALKEWEEGTRIEGVESEVRLYYEKTEEVAQEAGAVNKSQLVTNISCICIIFIFDYICIHIICRKSY